MLDKNKVKLGIAPIAWTNDDMPDLGSENTFEQCISEMAPPALPAAKSATSIRETTYPHSKKLSRFAICKFAMLGFLHFFLQNRMMK